jgi:hypothetical protein
MFTVNGHTKVLADNERHVARCASSLFDATRDDCGGKTL